MVPAPGPWEESRADALAGGKCPAGTVPAIRQAIDVLELPVNRGGEDKRIQASAKALQGLEFLRIPCAGGQEPV